jgi:kumamolisin
MAPNDVLALSIVLAPTHQAELDALVDAIYDPNSADYGRYLTPEAFRARFHPDAAAIEQMRTQLAEQGLAPDDAPHGLVWRVHATVADVERALNVQMHMYQAPDGRTYHAPEGDVTLWANLPVTAIVGLYQAPVHRPNYHQLPNAHRPQAHAIPNQSKFIRTAYNIPAAATGKGQVLALFELDGYLLSDMVAYAKANNIAQVPLVNILVDGFSGTVQDAGAQGEVTLDIQVMNATAPNAAQIRVYEGPQTVAGFLGLLNEMANPTLGDKFLPPLISCSWGIIESQSSNSMLAAENALFKQMAVQGQSFFAASGDSGSDADGSNRGVQDPSSQPYVVGVGGTSLYVKSTDGSYSSESVWGGTTNGTPYGTGGGISGHWPIPSYQRGVVSAATLGSSTMRNVPDVALNSDPATGYAIYLNNAWQTGVGGTSAAAPIWTAIMGLVNEQRALKGVGPIGFVNPLLYRINQTTAYAQNFHDIDDGTDNGYYPAVTGWDDATGWGSCNGANLIDTLAAGYPRRTFSKPDWLD